VHWYKQLPGQAPKRTLYVSGQSPVFDDSSDAWRFQVRKHSSEPIYSLTINYLTPRDSGTYYCAYWDYQGITDDYYKVFGTGTKLIVSDKGNSAPSNAEILQEKNNNSITYVCLIEKFYPEVIRVTWTDEQDKEVKDNVVKGDVWELKQEEKYSISSWLTVPLENKDKNYSCKYDHESNSGSLPTKDSVKTVIQEEDCKTSPGNGTVFNRDHLMHRTAYLVYIVLLLKSSMYYFIVLFFIYR
ncbi:hypothetical protein Z169_14205, partial [Egretta garzetta]